MVTVTEFKLQESQEGESYIRLILEGELEMVRSEKTGNYYAHVRRASISSTLNEEQAARMVGKTMKGSITKVEVDSYKYELENGDVLTLNYRWAYNPKEGNEHTTQNGQSIEKVMDTTNNLIAA